MSKDDLQQYLESKYAGAKIKYVGSGTDSTAFRVDDKICRFPHNGMDVYEIDAAICNCVRSNISVPIPHIQIVHDGEYSHAVHKMIQGHKWSWHKFSWKPVKQRNLTRSYANFLAQLHGADVRKLRAAVPVLNQTIPYCSFDEIKDFLARFMTSGQLKYFRRHYEQIINAPVADTDLVFVHMGMKGANSVVDENGAICGVFDFCSGGIYERGRDFVLVYLGHNKKMFNGVLREYHKLTGRRVNAARVKDLAAIEFLWRRRIFPNGEFAPRNDHFIRKNIAMAMARFHRWPNILYWLIYLRMSHHQRKCTTAK